MNKIYKVIWSKAKHCYVVVSELAKNHTKGCNKRSLRRTAVSLGIVAALLGGFSGSAWADGSGTIAANATGVITAGDNITISASTVSGSGYDAPITTITISATDTTYTAGNGLQLTGTEFSVKNADSTISVDASGIKVNVGSVAENNTGLVTGGAVYTALSAKADSATTYTKTEVDTALGTKADKDGSNVTTPATWANKLGTGTVGGNNDALLVTGATVSTAVTNGSLALSGATLNAEGDATVGGTLGVTGEATVGSLKIGTTDYEITSEGAATVSSLTIGTTNVGETLAAKADITALEDYAKADASNITVSDWATKLGADTIASDSVSLVKGSTVYDYLNGTTSNPKLALGANSTSISIGKDNTNTGTDSWNNEQTGTEYIAIGQNIKTLGNKNIAIGTDVITQAGSTIAIGEGANAMDQFATAIGSDAKANNYGTVAVGYQANASGGNSSTAVGNGAYANGMNALAIGGGTTQGYFPSGGRGAQATANNAIAVGYNAKATQSEASAIGSDAKATAYRTVALGSAASASASYASAIGSEAKATWSNAVALGHGAEASIMVEDQENPGTQIPGETESATALGAFSKAQSDYATAVGANAKASGLNSIAIGGGERSETSITAATASENYSIAIGYSAQATASSAVAIGHGSNASGAGAIALGEGRASGDHATAWGYGVASGNYSTAWGELTLATASGNYSTAWGQATASSSYSTAWGRSGASGEYSTSWGEYTSASGKGSTAWGSFAYASGNFATAFGGNNGYNFTHADAENSLAALGGTTVYDDSDPENVIDAKNSVAIGIGAKTTAANAFAFGNNAQAILADSVALGSGSVANRASGVDGYLKGSSTGNAWTSTHNAVAVGNGAQVTRQITGVAAGSEDTDAVNVAQLKSATPVINSEHNYYDGSTIAVKVTDAVNAVDAALGKVAAGSNYLAVYDATTPTGTFAENLTALDTAIGKVTAGNYITASEGTAATSLATQVQALDTALGAKITADGNYIRVANSINANISALDTQAKANADAISTNAGNIATLQTTATATTAAIGTLTDDGYYIKESATNNVSQNLSALDTQVKTNADDIVTLQTKAQNITATAGTTTMKGVLNVTDSTGATTGVAIDGAAKTITAGGVVINGAANTMAVGDVAVNGAAKTITTGNVTIDGAANSITLNGTSNTLKVGGVTISDNGTAKTITGLSNTTWDADNITSGQAATEDQLKAATISLTNGGLKFTANRGGTVTNKLGSTVGVIGGGSKEDDKYSESNVKTVIAQDATGNSTITVKLDKDPSFDSVTATGKVQGASLTDGTATLTGGALSNVTDLTANGTATFGSGTSTVIVSGGAVTATGNISGADITASGMLSSASLKVNGVDVTTPLSTAGAVVSGNAGFVTGGTVYSEVRPATDGNYVKTANSTAANLTALDSAIGMVAADGNYIKKSATNNVSQNVSALDTQVKTNADNIAMLQSSTTAAVGTLTEDGNYIKKSDTNNVVQNLSALDTQAKTNADNIAANKTAIGTTADGSYVKAANTVGKNLNALDTQVKTNTDDIATLKNSISVQEDPSGVKITTIEGNLVIKEEDGTKKDVTAALSTDGEVAKQGDAGSEGYLKGETVYDYLNKDSLELGANSKKIAMGSGSKIKSGTKSIAIGFDNAVDGDQNVVIGTGHEVKGNNNIAVGDPINIDGNDNGVFSNTATVTGNRTYAMGYQVTITGDDTVVLGNNINGTASNAVVLGNNSTPEDGAVSVGSKDGERQIKHVAPGTDANDAATVGQLGALAQAADNGINRLDSKVNKVGAGAAALAALHPIDTDDKFTMGLGYGNYRNAHSAAIGLFYRPTEKVMISVGGTLGNGENMINAGISFALDKGKGFGTSKAMMARKIAAQEEKITQQDAKIQSLEEENAKLAARLAAIEEKLAK